MSAPPKTVLAASPEEERAIRDAVRHVDPATLGPGRAIAGPEHADRLVEFLSDPRVSEPIYDLPRPFTRANISRWIVDFAARREKGEGLLIVTCDPEGPIAGYSQFTVWPERASAELAGAIRADLQNAGGGGAGALRSFDWMFEELRVRLIGLTASLDNTRSARLIEHAGFVRMGERESLRPDGTIRRSLYWELARAAWAAGGRDDEAQS